jgi:hypothetical protein
MAQPGQRLTPRTHGPTPRALLPGCGFDLATSHPDPQRGILLCAALKPWHGPPRVFRTDAYWRSWLDRRPDDRRLVLDIAAELVQYHHWFAQNGRRLDLPLLRKRLVHGGPKLPWRTLLDPWRLARSRFGLTRRGLDPLVRPWERPPQLAERDRVWDRATLEGLVQHCLGVVDYLERVLDAAPR